MSNLSQPQSAALKKFLTGRKRRDILAPDASETVVVEDVTRTAFTYRTLTGARRVKEFSRVSEKEARNMQLPLP